MIEQKSEEVGLSTPYLLEYNYKRTLGPVLTKFFTGLREGELYGIVATDGRVLMPPQEYDPITGAELSEFVVLGDTGVVTTWSWIDKPRDAHPVDHPFAFALIQLDGADTSFVHVVSVDSADQMQCGMRVRAKWSKERVGYITDISSFIPEEGADE